MAEIRHRTWMLPDNEHNI